MQNSNEYPLLREIAHYLDEVLHCSEFQNCDVAQNGLQVGDKDRRIRKVAAAVDASLESFERSADSEAELLLVHHGILWGQCDPIVGPEYQRLSLLINKQLSLYAAHLPLDAHLEHGNNIHLAECLKLQDILPFGAYKGKAIGCGGTLVAPSSLDEICGLLALGQEALRLDFCRRDIHRIAIVSGGGALAIPEAAAEGYDLFITGELHHQHYHAVKELGLSALAMGHYRSEMGGVMRLLKLLQKKWPALSTEFIDLPTGL